MNEPMSVAAAADAASTAASSAAVKTAVGGGLVAVVGGLSQSELIAICGALAALLGSVVQAYLAWQRRRDEHEMHLIEMAVMRAKLADSEPTS